MLLKETASAGAHKIEPNRVNPVETRIFFIGRTPTVIGKFQCAIPPEEPPKKDDKALDRKSDLKSEQETPPTADARSRIVKIWTMNYLSGSIAIAY